MGRPDLERLSLEELIEPVLRLQRPAKTSRTSSKPPSGDRKDRREGSRLGGVKAGHEGRSRMPGEAFDRLIDHRPETCTGCHAVLPADLAGETVSQHDAVELPPVRPVVERHRRLAVCCPACGRRVPAAVPGAATRTPFGARIHAIATYRKTFQALSYERLQGAFSALFGLTISQGGLMNMLRRARAHFVNGRVDAVAKLRQASIGSSDETGVRIEGTNAYHRMFRCDDAVVHTAALSRGAVVARTMMDGHRPAVWCSDRYAAQQGHADAHQTCLAHLARDVAFARQNSEDPLPTRLDLWLRKAFGLARDIGDFAAATIARRRRALERDMDAILATPTTCDLAMKLRKRFARARDQLLTFVHWPGQVEPTNNACERDLRPAVIQRKVTNGYRAMWAAQGEADVRTVVANARLTPGNNAFGTIAATLGA